MANLFHLAFPVKDLEEAISFYHEFLGCPLGRTTKVWADFDFFGNQITAHLRPEECHLAEANEVDGDQVPVRHFGAILEWDKWENLGEKIQNSDYDFLISPKVRFRGKPGEQGTFFLRDPSGNALEFKTFKSKDKIFETEQRT